MTEVELAPKVAPEDESVIEYILIRDFDPGSEYTSMTPEHIFASGDTVAELLAQRILAPLGETGTLYRMVKRVP